jgi:hypothetical protein
MVVAVVCQVSCKFTLPPPHLSDIELTMVVLLELPRGRPIGHPKSPDQLTGQRERRKGLGRRRCRQALDGVALVVSKENDDDETAKRARWRQSWSRMANACLL